jgi:hypothetical protein
MPVNPLIPQVNLKRPECVALANRIKELRALQQEYRDQLRNTRDLEERQQILDILAGLEEHISALLEELAFQGCYVVPTQRGLFLKLVGLEATQSTQFFALEGTGAGANNSIPLVANKPTLARVYLRSELQDAITVTGRLTVSEFNKNTLKRPRPSDARPGAAGHPAGAVRVAAAGVHRVDELPAAGSGVGRRPAAVPRSGVGQWP